MLEYINRNKDLGVEGRLRMFGLSALTVLLVAGGGHTHAEDDAAPSVANINCPEEKVCRNMDTLLPLRVLPRPRSSIYAEQSTESTMVAPVVPAFSPLFVFAREGVEEGVSDAKEGWYQVGPTDELSIGWMQAADVIEWHSTLILSYTPPGVDDEKRNRVLGFNSFDKLTEVVESEDRMESAEGILNALAALEPGGETPAELAEAGIVSAEPEGVFIDVKDNFYMWPILSWAAPEDPEAEERYIEFVQLVPECKADVEVMAAEPATSDAAGSDTETDSDAGSDTDATGDTGTEAEPGEFMQMPPIKLGFPGQGGGQKEIQNVEMMFVVDTTGSMEPYIRAVRSGIVDVSGVLEEKAKETGTQGIGFGFVGYQDEFDKLDYVTNDFTAEGFVDANTLAGIVEENVKAEDWGDHMIPEKLFEGVQAGVGSAWSDDSLKFMVVVTDAPAIPESSLEGEKVGDDYVNLIRSNPEQFEELKSISIEDAQRNGQLAAESNVTMIVLHIKSNRFPELDSLAGEQLQAMSSTEAARSLYFEVDGSGGSNSEFDEAIQQVAGVISAALGADSGNLDEVVVVADDTPETDIIDTEELIKSVKAAAMDFLGNEEITECDYSGWTTDRDLADEYVRALEVNTLLAHHQLNTLYGFLKDISGAMAMGEVTGMGFVESLQQVSTTMMQDPDRIEAAKAGKLGATGLLPKWLENLPYRSDIAHLTIDDVMQMTSAEQATLEINIQGKAAYYEQILSDNARWFALSEKHEDVRTKQVTPLPVTELP